jgi:hypothetical protein
MKSSVFGVVMCNPLTFNRLHSVTLQRVELFITTAVRTINPLQPKKCLMKIIK